jgi:hypothetical protein
MSNFSTDELPIIGDILINNELEILFPCKIFTPLLFGSLKEVFELKVSIKRQRPEPMKLFFTEDRDVEVLIPAFLYDDENNETFLRLERLATSSNVNAKDNHDLSMRLLQESIIPTIKSFKKFPSIAEFMIQMIRAGFRLNEINEMTLPQCELFYDILAEKK